MSRIFAVIFFAAAFAAFPFSTNAQKLYVGTELGLGLGSSLDTDSRDTDSPTLCDKYLDPQELFSPAAGCSVGDSWNNSFGRSTGIITGLSVGVAMDFGARIEAEYFYLGLNYNETSQIGVGNTDIQNKAERELVRSDERIGSVDLNSLFLNVYYDLPASGRIRPYAGGGVGFGLARLDYTSVWSRNIDPDALRTAEKAVYNGSGDEAADKKALLQRIAGTTTTASHRLKDTLFGYQAVVGVDYMLTEKTSIGIKGRWVKYAKFSNGREWDQLRGHSSDNGPGMPKVVYTVETDDLSAFALSATMKYSF